MSRNELCNCGSGKRFKHCHGSIEAAAPSAMHLEAVAAHRSGALRRAEALYRRALQDAPTDVDSLHMLGVVLFERTRYREALDRLWEAAERTGWTDAIFRQNLGLVLAKLLSPQANARQEAVVAEYLERARTLKASPAIAARVSVVLPVCNGARFVARAIASVAAQSYRDVELVVVDDGSIDDTAAVVAHCLSGFPFPAELVRREHRGAAQAANAGAECAQGRYLAFLDTDDWFAPDRIERLVADIARATPLWGFSQVTYAGIDGSGDHAGGKRSGGAPSRRPLQGGEPASFTLLERDLIGSSGNLFVDRTLFHELGGYRDLPQYRGWDFCVRAAQAVEPIAVDQPLYFQGGQDRRPPPGTTARRAAELVANALTSNVAAANTLCPQFIGNRDLVLRSELRAGRGDRLPVPMLRSLTTAWRARAIEPVAACIAAEPRRLRARSTCAAPSCRSASSRRGSVSIQKASGSRKP